MNIQDRELLLWLSHLGVTEYKQFNKIIEYFGNFQELWRAKDHHIKQLFNNNSIIAEKMIKTRNIEYINTVQNTLKEKNIKFSTILDDDYPAKLKDIYDPPYVIYMKGKAEFDTPLIALVGSRKASTYGKWAAYHFAKELANWGVGVISGMALGIDAEGHRGALDNNGYTVGVLGFGIDVCYPASNRRLKEDITQKGCIISEYPPESPPLKYHFPARNRIISGMSEGVLIIEAAEKSGALITVDFALDQGKDVYALPGNINNMYSKGTNQLIKDGAKITLEVEDIIIDLKKRFNLSNDLSKTNVHQLLGDEELIVYNIINKKPVHIDRIAYESGMNISKINSILSILELKGLIYQLPGKIFTIN